ncbi:MAG: hypothetical protein IK080_07330 [Clostridia bacterium]|nr:hypothetical protein [Clostridia bacterium]
MKKIIAVALALIFALSFCTVIACAEDAAATSDAASSIDFAAILTQVMNMLKKVDWQKLMSTMMNLVQQLMATLSSASGK